MLSTAAYRTKSYAGLMLGGNALSFHIRTLHLCTPLMQNDFWWHPCWQQGVRENSLLTGRLSLVTLIPCDITLTALLCLNCVVHFCFWKVFFVSFIIKAGCKYLMYPSWPQSRPGLLLWLRWRWKYMFLGPLIFAFMIMDSNGIIIVDHVALIISANGYLRWWFWHRFNGKRTQPSRVSKV